MLIIIKYCIHMCSCKNSQCNIVPVPLTLTPFSHRIPEKLVHRVCRALAAKSVSGCQARSSASSKSTKNSWLVRWNVIFWFSPDPLIMTMFVCTHARWCCVYMSFWVRVSWCVCVCVCVCLRRRLHQHQLRHDVASVSFNSGSCFGHPVHLEAVQFKVAYRRQIPRCGDVCARQLHFWQLRGIFWNLYLLAQERQSKFLRVGIPALCLSRLRPPSAFCLNDYATNVNGTVPYYVSRHFFCASFRCKMTFGKKWCECIYRWDP